MVLKRFTRGALRAATVLMFLIGTCGNAHADTLTLMWDQNPEPELLGYVVHVGTKPGVYTGTFDVGHATWFVFRDAHPGKEYFFSVAAYGQEDVWSPRSEELAGFSNAWPSLEALGDQTSMRGATVALQLAGSDPLGEPLSYAATGLPPGLTLMPSTGFIAGAAKAHGKFRVTVSATDGVLSTFHSFVWTVPKRRR